MRGIAKFSLGGTDYNLPVPLSVAEELEAATGQGVMRLMREILTQDATLTNVVTVLTVALNSHSKARKYTRQQVADIIAEDGMLAGYVAAGRVLGALFDAPEEAKTAKGKAPKSQATTSQ